MNAKNAVRNFLMKYSPAIYNELSRVYNLKYVRNLPLIVDSLDPELEKIENLKGFIQIGANDGIRADLINKYINQKKWKGVLIEPVPYLFDQLVKNYSFNPNLHFENVAISDKKGKQIIYSLRKDAEGDSWIHGLASFDKAHVLRFYPEAKKNDSLVEETEVELQHINEMLRKYSSIQFDLLCMDTEGHDEVILRSIDYSIFRPNYVIFEHKFLPLKQYLNLIEYLKEKGYNAIRTEMDTLLKLKQ